VEHIFKPRTIFTLNLVVPVFTNLSTGGEYEFKSPKDILLKYARDPNAAPIFNYASMAHNNHFFFKCLSPESTTMPEPLRKALEASFSSIETLQREFVVTASSMFGPGFIWLVKTKEGKFSLLTTFLAGSPYPGAHYRRQTVDMNTESNIDGSVGVSGAIREKIAGPPVNQIGSYGRLSERQLAPGGIDLTPVLCLNTWEHVYLRDYGVGAFGSGGKKAFANTWWHKIDWNVVDDNAGRKHSFMT
jgi:superoxide dismutase, Fe-Mn family